MARTNLTVQLDADVIKRAKVVAAERGTSVSALVAQEIDDLVTREERYADARRRAFGLMDTASPLGGRSWSRDELYADRVERPRR